MLESCWNDLVDSRKIFISLDFNVADRIQSQESWELSQIVLK